jgi:hypothetical protein
MASQPQKLPTLLPMPSSAVAKTPARATPRRRSSAKKTVTVNAEQQAYHNDQVIGSLHNLQAGLTHVQNGITDLLSKYINHTTSVLIGEDGEMQLSNDVAAVAASAMEIGRNAGDSAKQVLASADRAVDAKQGLKRKRAKKEKDPNAPKKPLTAAFLYAQSARPIIKQDLEAALQPGQQIEKNAVQIEVNKRWNELPEEQKEASLFHYSLTASALLTSPQQWKAAYRNGYDQYKIELAEYAKNKGKAADLAELEEASDEGEPELPFVEVEMGAADTDASDEDEDEVPAKASSPPAKTPRKRQKTTPAVNGNSVPVAIAPAAAASTPIPLPASRTVPVPAAPVAETPAKKDKKKKEKVAPQPIAPAPVAEAEEPSHEETNAKKKAKSGRSTRANETDADKDNGAAAAEKEKAEKAGKEKKRDRSKRKSEVASS